MAKRKYKSKVNFYNNKNTIKYASGGGLPKGMLSSAVTSGVGMIPGMGTAVASGMKAAHAIGGVFDSMGDQAMTNNTSNSAETLKGIGGALNPLDSMQTGLAAAGDNTGHQLGSILLPGYGAALGARGEHTAAKYAERKENANIGSNNAEANS